MALPRAPAELLTHQPAPLLRHRHGSALDPGWECMGGAAVGISRGESLLPTAEATNELCGVRS